MKKKYKVDLHTHSIISHDGGISRRQYKEILNTGILDYVAITDHNDVSFARQMQKEIGERIIIGEEIKTKSGEVVGLFLKKTIASGMVLEDTIFEIKKQGGLVYVPHPFETVRSGIKKKDLTRIAEYVDIIEVFNARGFLRGKPDAAYSFAWEKKISMAASSDAHCKWGIGNAYSSIESKPTKKTLSSSLRQAELTRGYASWYSAFCPSINKFKNKIFI